MVQGDPGREDWCSSFSTGTQPNLPTLPIYTARLACCNPQLKPQLRSAGAPAAGTSEGALRSKPQLPHKDMLFGHGRLRNVPPRAQSTRCAICGGQSARVGPTLVRYANLDGGNNNKHRQSAAVSFSELLTSAADPGF